MDIIQQLRRALEKRSKDAVAGIRDLPGEPEDFDISTLEVCNLADQAEREGIDLQKVLSPKEYVDVSQSRKGKPAILAAFPDLAKMT